MGVPSNHEPQTDHEPQSDPDPMKRRGILLRVAYDGAAYSGIAIQINGHTIAHELQRSIAAMAPDASNIRSASRTDAGVHAEDQAVAFDTSSQIGARGWLLGLTGHLPRDIAITSVAFVAEGYDPSKHAIEKTYRYLILQGTVRDPFLRQRSWRVFERLNHRLMAAEADLLLGEHDFRAFRGAADGRDNTVRNILRASVTQGPTPSRVLTIEVSGNRFLYNMVRIIVGTLIDVGRGKKAVGAVSRAIQSGERNDLGMTAPADGLFLHRLVLDDNGEGAWPRPEKELAKPVTPLAE